VTVALQMDRSEGRLKDGRDLRSQAETLGTGQACVAGWRDCHHPPRQEMRSSGSRRRTRPAQPERDLRLARSRAYEVTQRGRQSRTWSKRAGALG